MVTATAVDKNEAIVTPRDNESTRHPWNIILHKIYINYSGTDLLLWIGVCNQNTPPYGVPSSPITRRVIDVLFDFSVASGTSSASPQSLARFTRKCRQDPRRRRRTASTCKMADGEARWLIGNGSSVDRDRVQFLRPASHVIAYFVSSTSQRWRRHRLCRVVTDVVRWHEDDDDVFFVRKHHSLLRTLRMLVSFSNTFKLRLLTNVSN